MIGVRLQPVDTWFFRDGTPFAMGSTPQENVGSLFPPHPPTVAGALRAALATLASGKGWNGRGRWPDDICKVLGDGPENLGALFLDGPFLLRDGRPLFRVPRHLLGVSHGGTHWKPTAFLRPGDPVACDLGDAVRLPDVVRLSEGVGTPPDAGKAGGTLGTSPSAAFHLKPGDLEPADLKPGDGFRLAPEGLCAALDGRLPSHSDLVPDKCLWSDEPRIGLERDGGTRTAREGMLYSTRHVRPARGVSLGVRIAGLPDGWTPPFGGLLTLGGEGRLAECREWKACREWEAELALEAHSTQVVRTSCSIEAGSADAGSAQSGALEARLAEIVNTRRVALVALTPLDLPRGICVGDQPLGIRADDQPLDICAGDQPLEALGNARVVSACLDRPQQVGGWDSLERRPLPLRPVLPPGSTLFCELGEPERFREAVSAGGGLARVGRRREWGFGLVAPGVWPAAKEDDR